jgi:two-component system, cell cycle sensor histidine kinase and response regulator CckA
MTASGAASPAERTTILVLEDDAAVLKTTARVLERAGYEVLAASSPAEAVRQVADPGVPLRLLVTDFSFEAVSGHQVAERLMRDRPDLRVLYISGHLEADVLPPERRHPGSAFLQKPFSAERLVGQVRELLR